MLEQFSSSWIWLFLHICCLLRPHKVPALQGSLCISWSGPRRLKDCLVQSVVGMCVLQAKTRKQIKKGLSFSVYLNPILSWFFFFIPFIQDLYQLIVWPWEMNWRLSCISWSYSFILASFSSHFYSTQFSRSSRWCMWCSPSVFHLCEVLVAQGQPARTVAEWRSKLGSSQSLSNTSITALLCFYLFLLY